MTMKVRTSLPTRAHKDPLKHRDDHMLCFINGYEHNTDIQNYTKSEYHHRKWGASSEKANHSMVRKAEKMSYFNLDTGQDKGRMLLYPEKKSRHNLI